MLTAGLVIGFRSGASLVDWLLIGGIIVLFTLAFSWLSAIVGVMAKSVEGVQWLMFVLVFPLTFASTAFVPSEGMNPILKVFALNQPITQVIEAVRALMLGKPLGNYGWLSVAWSLGILVVAVPLASWLFRRRTSR
jgi:ABC-2 type transport system permease protein